MTQKRQIHGGGGGGMGESILFITAVGADLGGETAVMSSHWVINRIAGGDKQQREYALTHTHAIHTHTHTTSG